AQDRGNRLALPVHAERRLRLRRVLGADPGGAERAGTQPQGAHAAQPQRLRLCARPRERQPDFGAALREGELGEPHRSGHRPAGHHDAVHPLTGEKQWRVPLTDLQIWSATLSTGGRLLFTGKETGEFIALDADTGTQLWQFQTGSGINAQPVTYTHGGRQYVTVLSGIGGLYWNINREALKNVPQGGSVWTFALMPD